MRTWGRSSRTLLRFAAIAFGIVAPMNAKGAVLVTGGSGFLGGWCIIKLLQAGYRVRTTLRDLKREAEVRKWLAQQVDAGDRLTFHAADLTNDEGWGAAIQGCEFVLPVASPF